MFGNGVAIGMTIIVRIAKRILQDHRLVVSAWSAVVIISILLRRVVCRIATPIIRRILATT